MLRHTCLLLCLCAVSPLITHAAYAAAVDTDAGDAARVLPQPAVDLVGGAGSVSPEPVKPRAKPTRRLVYSCVAPAMVTFADRPCGVQPVLRELVVQPGIPPGATSTIGGSDNEPGRVRPAAGGATGDARETAVADETTKHDDACGKLRARLDQVDAQMRAGYGAAQAGRLWDRWRDAKQRLRENRC